MITNIGEEDEEASLGSEEEKEKEQEREEEAFGRVYEPALLAELHAVPIVAGTTVSTWKGRTVEKGEFLQVSLGALLTSALNSTRPLLSQAEPHSQVPRSTSSTDGSFAWSRPTTGGIAAATSLAPGWTELTLNGIAQINVEGVEGGEDKEMRRGKGEEERRKGGSAKKIFTRGSL